MKGKKNSFGNKHTEMTKNKISKANKGRKLLETTRAKMSESKKGEKPYLWKGGITSLRGQIYNSRNWKKWRSDIFERDNWICQTCNIRSKKGNLVYLEAHHIKEFSEILEEYNIKTLEEALNCKKLWDINNGITLCKECHNLTKHGNYV